MQFNLFVTSPKIKTKEQRRRDTLEISREDDLNPPDPLLDSYNYSTRNVLVDLLHLGQCMGTPRAD